MIDIKFSSFFDRRAVTSKVDKVKRKLLSKAGAFVRTRARRSIRNSKKTAKPGNPPNSHVGLLKRLILFGYESSTESVVIGPTLFRRKSPTVPEILEHGGLTTSWRSGRSVTYDRFPFMEPAMVAEADNFHGLFANAVK